MEPIDRIEELAILCHETAREKGFWRDNDELFGGDVNHPIWLLSRLGLIHSEVSEALEEVRKVGMDPTAFVEELADILIRVFDLAGGMMLGWLLAEQVNAKMEKNRQRPPMHGKTA